MRSREVTNGLCLFWVGLNTRFRDDVTKKQYRRLAKETFTRVQRQVCGAKSVENTSESGEMLLERGREDNNIVKIN